MEHAPKQQLLNQGKQTNNFYTLTQQTVIYLNQGLPFHSTIVQREFTHIAYALLFSRRSDCIKHTCQQMLSYCFYDCKLSTYYALITH